MELELDITFLKKRLKLQQAKTISMEFYCQIRRMHSCLSLNIEVTKSCFHLTATPSDLILLFSLL